MDGQLTRRSAAKNSSRGVVDVCVGDIEYADDTQIFGFQEEVATAETLFNSTLLDWAQAENVDKRETLVLCSGGRLPTETLAQFERRTLKHLGAFLNDCADYWPDTRKRVQAGYLAVKRIARLWSLGTPHGRGCRPGLSTHRKLKVMKAVLEGTVLACSKTRVWSKVQEKKMQVLSRGVRPCLGLDVFSTREHKYSDAGLRRLVHWDSFEQLLHRNVLRWVGHVACVPISRLPKIALFGWPASMTQHRSGRYSYPMWIRWLLQKYGISRLDWFRQAQHPGKGLRSRYDSSHSLRDAEVTTVFHSQCATCGQVFVAAIDARRRRCAAFPHHTDDIKPLPDRVAPSFNLAPHEISGWAVYTDGAGPSTGRPHAGWGVAIWERSCASRAMGQWMVRCHLCN